MVSKLSVCVSELFELHKTIKKEQDDVFKQIFILLDILNQGTCSVPYKALYTELRQLQPEQMPVTELERRDFFKQISLKNYARVRIKIQERINKLTSEEKKQVLRNQLMEIDSINDIVQTIDSDSSEDYMKIAMHNVYLCLQKIAELEQSNFNEDLL
jgi:hypothetical protein